MDKKLHRKVRSPVLVLIPASFDTWGSDGNSVGKSISKIGNIDSTSRTVRVGLLFFVISSSVPLL